MMRDPVEQPPSTRTAGEREEAARDPRLALALRAANIGIWDWNLASNLFDYSDRARAIYGFPPTGPITIEMVRDVTHPDDLPYTSAQARRAMDAGLREDLPYEYRILRADTGEVRWVRAEGHAVFEEAGKDIRPVRYIGCVQDITDSKRAAAALEESERRQRLALEAAGMAVWEFDVRSGTMSNSPDLKRLFGFDPASEVSVEAFRDCYLPGERERTQKVALKAYAEGDPHFEVEFRIRRKDGQERWLLLRAEILVSVDGQPERLVGVLMDIDERKRNAERQVVLMRELNHRVKNSLSVVQSIAGQTFRRGDIVGDNLEAFRKRLRALADANDILVESEWSSFDLDTLIGKVTSPYRNEDSDPFRITGSHIRIPPRLNVPLALALNELATNAAKYGALANRDGKVAIHCDQNDATAFIEWTEYGSAHMPVEAPRHGFGLKLLTKVLAPEFESISYELRLEGAYCLIAIRR
jgi:PAS domain S-box-containing protein